MEWQLGPLDGVQVSSIGLGDCIWVKIEQAAVCLAIQHAS
jgi:hypothetical protein